MAKTKSKATIMAADGAGGMAQVQDRRFEGGDWPIRFDIPTEQAETWLHYFWAECGKRGWNCTSMQQVEAKENSGSITVNTEAAGQLQLVVVWERKRGGSLKVRARSSGASEFPIAQAEELFQEVNGRCRAGATERFYLRGQLYYEGLPWKGELWLSDTLRLGPPSRHDETALIGQRVIVIDARVAGIDRMNASSAFQVVLSELSVFLSVVMRREVRLPPNGSRAWAWTTGPSGQVECDIRNLGYYERDCPSEIPARGQAPAIPLVPVQRPDFSFLGISVENTEQRVPADILDLWQAFAGLPPGQRKQFLQVGSLWRLALSLGHEYETARFALMVAACEALKPAQPQFNDHNIYHVAEALLGKPTAGLLQEEWFRPQDVRNAHLHRGEFRGSEFTQPAMMPSFQDPTFGESGRVLAQITPAAIIEWLRRDGNFSMPPLKRRRSWRRWAKEHAVALLPILTIGAVAVGLVLGWLLRTL